CHVEKPDSAYYDDHKDPRTGLSRRKRSKCKACMTAAKRKQRTCFNCQAEYVHIGSSGARRRLCDDCGDKGRICGRCDTYKDASHYYIGRAKPRGNPYCKPCARAYNREVRYGIPRGTAEVV